MAYDDSKDEVKKMCEALIRDQVGDKSCTNAKVSFEWILSRFNTTIPKMIMYLNHSLTVLSDAEVKVKNASVTVVEDAQEFVCNMSNRMDSINKVFNEYKGHNVDKLATTNISSVVSKLNKSKSLTDVVKSTASALNVILKTDTAADSADVWIEKARSIHNNVSFTSEKANELNKKGEQIIEMVKGAQSELKRHNDTARDALQKGSEHIHELVNNFTAALNLTANHDKTFFKDVNNCLPGVHVASNMTPDKAAEVIERLAHSRLANATEELSVPLQNCEMKVSSLKNIIAQVDSNCSVAQKVAVEIDRAVDWADEQSEEIQQIAVQAVVSELKSRRDALCALHSDLHTLKFKLESLKGRDDKAVRTISELRRVVDNSALDASKAKMTCERIAAAVNKAVVFRPEATEGQTSLDSYVRCITTSESASKDSSKVSVAAHKAEELHVKARDLQKTTDEKQAGKHNELAEAKAILESLLTDAFGARFPLPQDACDPFDFSKHTINFPKAQNVSKKLPNIGIVDLAEVKQNIEALNSLVLQAEGNITEASKRAVDCEEGAKKASRDA
ncbi:hypothetical protein, conserved in T. vivax [Trypanosoma vivax Y486]|uniref:Uncharacterized protein n=1 Tax=Trypanosoma vivax (strain Y486) TaxID=1055687 RepID=F9WVR5_TRYVY|nr:hypothetical protein, conserved in T. vivax [Trypanosoma vivax Y486]|eukprot:CCD21674.1 hypothetical protein, conserved in T. vivax [Trypanosoma vivax Y486]